tara:strand:+ start:448 stop:789 length:342 start_codon:yes stop_codon:yes gene_type:complete
VQNKFIVMTWLLVFFVNVSVVHARDVVVDQKNPYKDLQFDKTTIRLLHITPLLHDSTTQAASKTADTTNPFHFTDITADVVAAQTGTESASHTHAQNTGVKGDTQTSNSNNNN